MSKEDLKIDRIKYKNYTTMQELGYCELAPTYGETFNWFRVKFNLQHCIEPNETSDGRKYFECYICEDFGMLKCKKVFKGNYRKCENWCIKQLIKFAIKTKL